MKGLSRNMPALFTSFGVGLLIVLSICIMCGLLFVLLSHPPTPFEEESYPTWSPDGQSIAFVCYLDGPTTGIADSNRLEYGADAAEICVVDSGGNNRIRLTENKVIDFGPTWSPDGTQIAYASRDGIYTINSDGSHRRHLFSISNIKHIYQLGGSVWSPDGKYLAFSACLDTQDHDIYVLNVSGGISINLTSGNLAMDEQPTWLPDSRQIMFLSSPLPVESCSSITSPSKSQLKLVNIDNGNETNIYDIESFYGAIALSTVTGQVAFTANIEAKNNTEALTFDPFLFTMKLGEKPISWGKVRGFLTWSPDGRYLAYVSSNNRVILLDAETGSKRELPSTFSPDFSLNWTPDGQKLAATVIQEIDELDVRKILIFDLNTNTVSPLIQK